MKWKKQLITKDKEAAMRPLLEIVVLKQLLKSFVIAVNST